EAGSDHAADDDREHDVGEPAVRDGARRPVRIIENGKLVTALVFGSSVEALPIGELSAEAFPVDAIFDDRRPDPGAPTRPRVRRHAAAEADDPALGVRPEGLDVEAPQQRREHNERENAVTDEITHDTVHGIRTRSGGASSQEPNVAAAIV